MTAAEAQGDQDKDVERLPLPLLLAIEQLTKVTIAWRNLEGTQAAAATASELRPPGELFLAHVTLDALIDMLRAFPAWGEAALPLERLRLALVDLEAGKTVEWLQPYRPIVNDDGNRKSGAARLSFVVRLQRGRVARISEYLKERVGTFPMAAKVIFESAPDGFAQELDGAPTAKTIERWRGQLNSSQAGSPERQGYDDAGQLLDEHRALWDGLSPEKAAECLLRAMAETPL